MKNLEENLGTGRRKRAVAAVRLRRGSGKVDINGRKMEEYFPSVLLRQQILIPFKKLSMEDQFDLIIRVKGGGLQAQAEASRLGIARALVEKDETLRKSLKDANLLTRDSRKKERKKYGLAGARKSFQFSKR